MQEISFTVHLFRDGDVIVAHANIKDAVRGFLEAAEEMGTLTKSGPPVTAGVRRLSDAIA